MGRDKARLEFQGQPMILHMAALVERVTGAPAVLLGPRERYGEFGLTMVEDDAENAGPLAGLVAMLGSAQAAELNLVLPVDMPDLDAGFVRAWIGALRSDPEADAAIPVTEDGSAPLAAVYRRRCHAPLAQAFGEGVRRVRTAIERLRCVEIAAPRGQLANLNTEEDWARFPRR